MFCPRNKWFQNWIWLRQIIIKEFRSQIHCNSSTQIISFISYSDFSECNEVLLEINHVIPRSIIKSYSLLNISDILRPAMVRVRRVTVLICGSVCSRHPASHPHGFKSYNNNHFRLFLTLFSIRSTKIWRKKHSIDYLHQNDSKVDMKGFWTDFPPRVWWW